MTQDDIIKFRKLQPKMSSTYDEISLLSKKNPNDAVNVFKLQLINNMLAQANALLSDDRRPFEDFESFSEESLPTTSDVVFVLSPYLTALERLRCDNIESGGIGDWYWKIDGKIARDLKTHSPTLI
jgi:hypothetical protein